MSIRRRASCAALVIAGAIVTALGATPARAQVNTAPRPWLDWRTAETEHFVFHFPRDFRLWTLALAERMEGVRAQVTRIVGYTPPRRVHVVVEDPVNLANGYAFTPLDAPTIVLWPTPPDPRTEIGNSRIWSELLATHEFAHVAHLTRPSRNRFQELMRAIAPIPLGPIATKAPRWVLEGYATYVEGRVTGSGRPNNAWRAAVIRQFALEGKMPAYSELSATGGWETGSFAYLMGSAYLEWLVRREGDSSLVALWRRLTAVTDRSFAQAFTGVYGAPPDELYGRFSAEVIADALAFERALQRQGVQEGTLVQRLTRTTGDPAVSPDGRYVALTIRRTDAPSQLVVWKTIDEPDTAGARARERQQARDPEDVPDRSFYPPPKKPVVTLVASDGAPYESPRWFADNKHLLVTRLVPMADGALRPDLYVWNADDGSVRRITHGAALRDADPSPDGRWAAAVQCAHGWCDLVRVDLASGEVRTIRGGTMTRNYYRPRVSRTTGEIVVAEQSSDRWRIARVDPRTGALRYLDPDDGVTRYDATWTPDGAAVVTTSEAGGIANIERLAGGTTAPRRLSSVTGAAVAPDVAADGSIWFLSLHGKGYDLRRLRPDTAREAPAVPTVSALADSLSPVLPPRTLAQPSDTTHRPTLGAAPLEHDYGFGPSRARYLPSATSSTGGSSTQLAIVRTDPVGRLGVSLLGSAGAAALPAGGALEISLRQSRTILTADGWISHEAPSRNFAAAANVGLDLGRAGGALRADRTHVGDGGAITATIAALSERRHVFDLDPTTRSAGILALSGVARQRDDETRYVERLDAMGELGGISGDRYLRQRTAIVFGTSAGSRPLTAGSFVYGSVGGPAADQERFVVGGIPSPLLDSLYDARRVSAPAYPLASRTGNSFAAYRLAVPIAPLEVYYAGVSTDFFRTMARSYGVELRASLPEIAALGTPSVDAVTGFARAVDEPVKDEWRYYVSVSIRP